jgi:hypothetical protein
LPIAIVRLDKNLAMRQFSGVGTFLRTCLKHPIEALITKPIRSEINFGVETPGLEHAKMLPQV